MIGVLALLAYIIAAVIFCLRALSTGDVDADWGFFCIAVGLALSMLGGAVVAVRSQNQ